MIRLNIIVEGDAEERFVNEVLSPHFGGFGITTSASKVVTSGRRGNAAAQGGGRRYGHWKDDLILQREICSRKMGALAEENM